MLEQKLLRKCIHEIENQLRWGPSQNWTNREFTELSYQISEKTGISLSTSSIRRLFGNPDDSSKPYNPQLETKNALAKFIGYTDWYDFKLSSRNNIRKVKAANKKRISLRIIVLFTILVLGLVVVSVLIFNRNRAGANNSFVFEGKGLASEEVPHTVVINYNVKNLNKPLYIDWDDVSPDATGGSDYSIVSNDSGSITHTYFFKDKYKIRLLDKDLKTLKSIQSIIYTNGWECYVYQDDSTVLVDSAYFINNTQMHADNEYLSVKGIDFTKPYRVIYRKLADFDIDGGAFNLKIDFKPEFRKEYIECGHVQIETIGSKGGNLITLMQKGCAGELSAIYLSSLIISGKTNDLSDFIVYDQKWNSFDFNVRKDSTSISLNGKYIYKAGSQPSIGNILGIRMEFHGNGIVGKVAMQ